MNHEDEARRSAELAGVRLAEAFRKWKIEAERPEQDLDVQAVGDAWELLTFREEQYREAIAGFKLTSPGEAICKECPD